MLSFYSPYGARACITRRDRVSTSAGRATFREGRWARLERAHLRPAVREARGSGRQHRAEPDAILDHLRESLLGLFQLEHLYARADAGEDAEGDRLLGIDGAAARPASDGLPA